MALSKGITALELKNFLLQQSDEVLNRTSVNVYAKEEGVVEIALVELCIKNYAPRFDLSLKLLSPMFAESRQKFLDSQKDAK